MGKSRLVRAPGIAAFALITSAGLAACADTDQQDQSDLQPNAQALEAAGAPALAAASAEAASAEAARSGGSDDRQFAGAPPEVRKANKEWPTANHDYAATRATFDSKIKASNVAKLQPGWAFPLVQIEGGYVGAATSSALVLDGVLYYQDQLSNVFAIEAKSGKQLWKQAYSTPGGAPNGIAVGWGKVFAASSDKSFVALDIKTGKELWKAPLQVPQFGGIGIQPIAYGGLVYLSTIPVNSTSQYAGGVNGTLYALNQQTGTIAWEFATVKDRNLWGHPEVNSGGGAWFPPTIDTQTNEIFWGIGNAAPYPGTAEFPLGSSRPGDNLYTNSVLALDAKRGDYHWHFQEAPHDLFDLDFQNPPIVVDARIGREDTKLIIGSGKTGTVIALDARKRDKLRWRTLVGRHENDKLQTFDAAGVDVYPGSLGGIIAPIAYADNTVYVPTVNWGRHYYPGSAAEGLIGTGTGELVAIDVSNGQILWTTQLPSTPYGSITVVNDLLFTSTLEGLILAYNRKTGAQVWQFQGPNGVNAPITAVGNQLFIPFGIGGPPGVPTLLELKLP